MRCAVRGILAEGAGSGAGSFPLLLAALLEAGHEVEFFGNPGFVRPRSLERFSGYRFRPLRVERAERFWHWADAFELPYPRAVASQVSMVAYEREAVRRIEEVDRDEPFDLILCTDAQALWPSRIPTASWPQSPPQTEAAALREPVTARAVVKSRGARYYAAVQAFYAYRWALARATLPYTSIFLCASRWAADEWVRFGARRESVRRMPYAFDVTAFGDTTAPGVHDKVTLLWLGRAAPRKRLDLFLAAFAEVRRRRPNVEARLVGTLESDPFAAPLLAKYRGTPGLSVEAPLPRERIPSLLGEVDVVVQPSQNENFGFSLAEALAAGRPVVAGPTNGTLEYAGAAGFAFESFTPASVARAIERAVDAVRSRGDELARSARAAAHELDTARVVDRFTRLCEEIAPRRHRGSSPP